MEIHFREIPLVGAIRGGGGGGWGIEALGGGGGGEGGFVKENYWQGKNIIR